MPDPHVAEVLSVEDRHYILATSSMADDRTLVLKDGDCFGVFDRFGDIRPIGSGTQGLYWTETRFLSTSSLLVGGVRPLLLSSTVRRDNAVLSIDLTNPDLMVDGSVAVPHGALHIFRTILLHEGACHQRLRVSNYGTEPVEVPLSLQLSADWRDVFEVRGEKRARRGEILPPAIGGGELVLAYRGLDGLRRRTRVLCSEGAVLAADGARFDARVPAGGSVTFTVAITCEVGEARRPLVSYEQACAGGDAARGARRGAAKLSTSNRQLDAWLDRSIADLAILTTPTEHGLYPYAGVPWFSTPFGRDGIITALQTLWIDPSLARGVLELLAATQATTLDPAADAEPGKILHEMRAGEMAATREVPFARYYGSIDSTPLFVVLAGAYFRTTADRATLERLWPNVRAALDWIERFGDRDGDGFVEYERRSIDGLVQQGWKDSNDSVFHEDGRLAPAPIALCEVQGYVYAALRQASEMAAVLGDAPEAERLQRKAEALRVRFEEAFWLEDLSTYALALDGDKRPCRVRSSNAGHCLWSGIADRERARRVAATLMSEESFSGWGVRTIAALTRRYNPMSYHNGSVWPHDNALVAAGFARYGLKEEAVRITEALFEASTHFELARLPELFCGFSRRTGKGPTLYPVACAPQAWASGAALQLLSSCLGLSIDAPARRISFLWPRLPSFVREMEIEGLPCGPAGRVDLVLHRYPTGVGLDVRARSGDVEVVLVK